MRVKRIVAVVLFLAIVLSVVGCGPAKPETPPPSAGNGEGDTEGKVFKIGGIAGLQTGFGQSMKKGADLAIEEINAAGGIEGYTFEAEWFDTEGTAATGRTVAQRLIAGGANAILGCHASTVVLAIEDLMSENKVLEVAMGSAVSISELDNPYVVRVRESDALTAKILANYIVDEAKLTKIAIIHMTDQYGTGGKDDMVAALKAKDLEPVTIQSHNAGDKDYSAQMLAMKKAGAEAMVIFSGATDNGIILKASKQLVPDIQIFQSSVGATKPVMDVAGEAAFGAHAVVTYTEDNPDPNTQEFVEAFKAKYNESPPDFFAPLSYDAVYMLAEALKEAGSDDKEALKDAFHDIKDFPGATGLSYSVAPNGETVEELLLIKIEEGFKHTVVSKVRL